MPSGIYLRSVANIVSDVYNVSDEFAEKLIELEKHVVPYFQDSRDFQPELEYYLFYLYWHQQMTPLKMSIYLRELGAPEKCSTENFLEELVKTMKIT